MEVEEIGMKTESGIEGLTENGEANTKVAGGEMK
jgi:hypothetical protein